MVCKTSKNQNPKWAGSCNKSATDIKQSTCRAFDIRTLNTLQDIVQHYIKYHKERAAKELSYYQGLCLQKAVDHAARARCPGGAGCPGKEKYSHQWRIRNADLNKFAQTLLESEALTEISNCNNFSDLWMCVGNRIGKGQGIGKLTIYDTALRIGHNRGIEPKMVFLHAGAREGARALKNAGITVEEENGILIGKLPKEFERLKPREIEDCLCVCKGAISGLGS